MAHTNVEIIRPGFLITTEWLKSEYACPHQVGRFKNVYPKGMRINTRNLNIARSKYRLNTRWLIETILGVWYERKRMGDIAGVDPYKGKWTKKDAGLLHSAFIEVLKERGNK